jgi:hypothetical protein
MDRPAGQPQRISVPDATAAPESTLAQAVTLPAMHRSRFYGLFIDAPLDRASEAVTFWAHALGATPVHGDEDDPFVVLDGAADVRVEVQAVGDTPRYHVDIETDDVAAEVDRLMRLGAAEVSRFESWVVLRAPGGGHLVCVVPVQSTRAVFDAEARSWD